MTMASLEHRVTTSTQNLSWNKVMIVLIVVGCSRAEPNNGITIKKIVDYLYYEDIGVAYLATGKLMIQTCTSENEINQDVRDVLKSMDDFGIICTKIGASDCKILQEVLDSKTTRLKQRIDTTKLYLRSSRSKRELMGRLLNYVFGVNDEVYEELEDLGKDQRRVQGNQNLIIKKVKELTYDTEAFNSTIQQMENVLEQAKNNMDQQRNEGLKYHTLMTQWALSNALIEMLEAKYESLLNPRLDEDIWDKASKLHEDVGVSNQFSTNTEWNGTRLCTTMTHQLYNKTEFQLIKLYQVIQGAKKDFSTVDVTNNLMGIGKGTTYFEMNTAQWKDCSILAAHQYLCHAEVILDAKLVPSCTTQLLRFENGESNCKYKKIELQNLMFQQLIEPNSWLFAVPQAVTVTTKCGKYSKNSTLLGSGKLTIKVGCNLSVQGRELRPNNMQQTKAKNFYHLDPRLHEVEDETKIHKNFVATHKAIKILNSFENWNTEFDQSSATHHHHHYMAPSMIGSSTIILVGIIFIVWKCKWSHPATTQPQSTPQLDTTPVLASTNETTTKKEPFGSKRWPKFDKKKENTYDIELQVMSPQDTENEVKC